jgi:hypothetical protein
MESQRNEYSKYFIQGLNSQIHCRWATIYDTSVRLLTARIKMLLEKPTVAPLVNKFVIIKLEASIQFSKQLASGTYQRSEETSSHII